MALSPAQQFEEALRQARQPLVVFPTNGDTDELCAALALTAHLKTRGVAADVVSEGFAPSSTLSFLPGIGDVRGAADRPRPMAIKVDLRRTSVGELRYEVVGQELHIVLTPKAGVWEASDVRAEPTKAGHDVIVAVGAADRQQLGSILAGNAVVGVPCVVIDNDAANERFGGVNVVDLTASSVCETVARLLGDAAFASEPIATLLLTGMTAATRGFRTANVTPATLALASKLVAAGAKRAEIIDRLYRTTSLSTMKLWGRALSRLKYDPASRLVWTALIRQDMVQSGAGDADLGGLVDQILSNATDADVAMVVYEREVGGGRTECWAVAGSDKYPSLAGMLPAGIPTERLGRHSHLKLEGADVAAAEKALAQQLAAALTHRPATVPA
jgi:nanoRNase/pAp phosphatase (c-di-AMP/oligoRNAs hydrolase)